MFSHAVYNPNNCRIIKHKPYHVIPFGHRYTSAIACKYANLRKYSLPFDWTNPLLPDRLQSILENDFDEFIPDVRSGVTLNKYCVDLSHFNSNVEQGILQYERRINRFRNILHKPDGIIYFVYINEDFLYNNEYRKEQFNTQNFCDMLRLEKFIKNKYPHINFTILYFNFQQHDIPPGSDIINIVLNTKIVVDYEEGNVYNPFREYCGNILNDLFNKPMTKIGISLGWNCHSATYGVQNDIRSIKEHGYKTCPFDKMISNFDGIVECIKDDFAFFTDEKYLSINANDPADPCIMNLKYRFGFNHESPGHADLYKKENWSQGITHFICDQYKNFKVRYQNRINNFRNYLSDPNNHITFIITSWDKTYQDMKPLKDALAIRYPNLLYEFVIINDPNGKEYFLRHMRFLGYTDHEYEVKRLLAQPQMNRFTTMNTPRNIKNFVIGLHTSFNKGGGGSVVQCHLANLLRNRGFNVRVLTTWPIPLQLEPPNVIFTHAASDKPYDIDLSSDDTIVIYSEGVTGNPFNGKNVVRWMLSELGKNVPHHRMHSWGKDEVVYYFNGEPKHAREPEKMGNIYKLLPLLYFNPQFKQTNYQPRDQVIHTFRKARLLGYHEYIHDIHPNDSTWIEFDNDHDKTIAIFNKYKAFYCYDPLTFLSFMAPVCGCYTIVHPVAGKNKKEWLSHSAFDVYMKEHNIEDLYGVGYGLSECDYARLTCHLAKQQWDDMQYYFNVTCLDKFLEDMSHFNDLKNRVGNNFDNSKNMLVLIYTYSFDYYNGGITTLYNLCKTLRENGVNAKMWCDGEERLNNICSDYYNKNIPIDTYTTIAIYPEVTMDNPIGAKYVIRWILGPFSPIEGHPDWMNGDYIYFYHSDIYFNENEILSIPNANNIYKFLSIPFMHPAIENAETSPANTREGYCHVIRKADTYGIIDFSHHPPDSVNIYDMTQGAEEFKKREFFVCYDPLTFYCFAATICGCITILINQPNVTKREWIDRFAIGKYFKYIGHYDLYGIAYGDTKEEISFAKNTIHLAKQQWDDIAAYLTNSTIYPFVQDLKNLPLLSNNVKNVFRSSNEELRELCLNFDDKNI